MSASARDRHRDGDHDRATMSARPVMVWSTHVAQALLKTPPSLDDRRHQGRRLALLLTGSTLVFVGVPASSSPVTTAGAACAATAVVWHGVQLWRRYCGCADLDVVGRFMAEHEHIVNHLGALRRSLHDPPGRRAAAAALAEHLAPHVDAEEAGLFTVMAPSSRLCATTSTVRTTGCSPPPRSTSGRPSGTTSGASPTQREVIR